MIVCDVCPRECKLEECQTGFCRVRTNERGENKDRLYQRIHPAFRGPYVSSVHKGKKVYQAILPGCNLQCRFCIYPDISKRVAAPERYETLTEVQFVEETQAWGADYLRCYGGEATIHYEYVLETARLARKRGILTDLETNGYIKPWLAEKIARAIDYITVGIKGSASPELYAEMDADPQIVLDSLQVIWRNNHQVLIGNLVGPSMKANREHDRKLATWICNNIGSEVEVHILYERVPFSTYRHIPAAAAGQEENEVWKQTYAVAQRFVAFGLVNVWARDTRGPWPEDVHVTDPPSRRSR